ncbi:hypothetical protein CHARACLAT_029813 [Characodon lateralis]|uniref:Uncharacterized protein n=1 Tax=Characodon lateralis TaxID=208331 RepID=A0ABU7ENG5_9TELE|nr:hypothetical protein [Characodon lateralis]
MCSVTVHPRSAGTCEVCIECRWAEEAKCFPTTLCGLVSWWLCGVALTCPLALPINYRWKQVPKSGDSEHTKYHSQKEERAGWAYNIAY